MQQATLAGNSSLATAVRAALLGVLVLIAVSATAVRVTTTDGASADRRRTTHGVTVLRIASPGRPGVGSAEEVARAFVAANASLLGVEATRQTLQRARRTSVGTIVEFEERAHGLRVFGTEVRVLVVAGAVRHVTAMTLSRSATPSLPQAWPAPSTLEAAMNRAVRRAAPVGAARVIDVEAGFERRGGAPAYRFLVGDDLGPLLLVVQRAEDGLIVDERTLRRHADIAGSVFDPNPVNTLNDRTLQDSSDACLAVPAAAYFPYLVQADDPVAGMYRLSGRYARIVDVEPPTGAVATSPIFDGFDFCRDESGFEEFNAYFWITTSAEYVESLGHALLNSPIEVDAHADVRDGAGDPEGPAFMGSPYETVMPGEASALMLLCDSFVPYLVDAGEDADVILHEHSHAIFHGLRPIAFCKRGEPDALNEGTADYWQARWSYNTSIANGFDPDCLAEWFTTGVEACLRRTDEPKTYPADLDPGGGPHLDGEMWSAYLLDLAFQFGSFTDLDRILLLAVELAPDAPSFYDMVQALFDADALLFGGSHAADIQSLAIGRGFDTPRPPEVSAMSSGVPLRVRKATGGQVTILWEDLGAAADGYNVYEGAIGTFPDGEADPSTVFPAPVCGIAGQPGGPGYRLFTGTPDFEDAYFLVTAFAGGVEGPAGYFETAYRCFERDPRANGCPP